MAALKAQAGIVTSRGTQYWAMNQEGTHFDTRFKGQAYDTPDDLIINTWYHIAMTWDTSGKSSTYVNGVLDGTASFVAGDYVSNGQWEIGLDDCCGGIRGFQGQLDDIAMFDDTLSAEEIKFMYDQGNLGNAIGDLKLKAVPAPVAYWPLDETSGEVAYDTIGNADGAYSTAGGAGLTWETGKINNGATLGGSGGHNFHVSTDPLIGAEQLTMTAWVNMAALKAQAGIVTTRGTQIWALIQEGTHIDLRVRSNTYDTPDDLVINTWYHLAITWDTSGASSTFVNGSLAATASFAAGDYVSNGHWDLGLDDCCGGIRGFQGQLDEIAMFDTALSPFDIKVMYDKGNLGIPISDYTRGEARMLSYGIANQQGNTVIGADDTIRVTVFAKDVTALKSTINVTPGATISPDTSLTQDFTNPFNYTVTGEDGITKKVYTVKVTQVIPREDADILTFDFDGDSTIVDINQTAKTIDVQIERTANLNSLTPTITISGGATVSPNTGVAQNFSTGPVMYTVTAEDGTTTQEYTVTVILFPRSIAEIISFTFEGISSTSEITADTIAIKVPYGTDLTVLTPIITLETGGTVDPKSGVANDFSSDVDYVVTAEDSIVTRKYVIKVSYMLNTETQMTGFVLDKQTGPAVIDHTASTVNIEVEADAIITELAPDITVSYGATVDPASGTKQNFTSTVSYTVTAENGNEAKIYFVSVVKVSGLDNTYSNRNVVYPNPASDFVQVGDIVAEKVQIFDASGKLSIEVTNTNTINLSKLSKGTYILKVYSNDMVYSNKLVINR